MATTRLSVVLSAAATAAVLAFACGTDEGAKKATASAPGGAPNPDGTPAPGTAPGTAPGAAPPAGPGGAPAPAGTPGAGPASPSGPVTGPGFYEATVKPLLVKECGACHVQGGSGPVTILDYTTARALLVQGSTPIDGFILRNMTNRIAHTGGNRCLAKGVTGTPCKEVMDWWKIEMGDAASVDGRIEQSFSTGEVRGWAASYKTPATILKVKLYDGPAATGTLLATVDANVTGFDGGYNGDHVFFTKLPASVNDAAVHLIHAYAEVDGNLVQLGEPFEHLGFTPNPAGKAHFDANVKPALTSACSSCHDFTYETAYRRLVNPTPTPGGTALDNKLINKPSASVSHGGGQRCTSKTVFPCNHLKTWWELEFQ